MSYQSIAKCSSVVSPKQVYSSLKYRSKNFIILIKIVGLVWGLSLFPFSYAQDVKATKTPAETPAKTSPLKTNFTKKIIQSALEIFPYYYWSQPTAKKKSQRKKLPSLSLNGKKYTKYECGVAEFVYNETLQKQILSWLGHTWHTPPSSTIESKRLTPWKAVIGNQSLEADFDTQKASGRFLHLSPQIQEWIAHLDFNPNDVIYGQNLQNLYNVVFKSSIRILASAHVYLQQTQRLDLESQAYVRAMMSNAFFHGPSYLDHRFDSLSLSAEDKDFKWCHTLSRSLGFWLRRHIDGSRPLLWKKFVELLNKFDPQWLAQHRQKIKGIYQKSPRFGGAISSEQRSQIYTTLLQQASLYNFYGSGKVGSISIGSKKLSWYAYGLYEIMYDMKLFQIIAKKLGIYSEFPTEQIVKKISGISLEQKHQEHEVKRPFLFINPKFVEWASDQLVPNPNEMIMGYKAKLIYQYIFKHSVHLFTRAYLYLQKNHKMKTYQLDYSLAMMTPKFNGGRYLNTKYAAISKTISKTINKTINKTVLKTKLKTYGYTPTMAIGFWLRRGIDGSAPIIWAALKAFLKRFDPQLSQEVNQEVNESPTAQ
jgi:hypothetical protein